MTLIKAENQAAHSQIPLHLNGVAGLLWHLTSPGHMYRWCRHFPATALHAGRKGEKDAWDPRGKSATGWGKDLSPHKRRKPPLPSGLKEWLGEDELPETVEDTMAGTWRDKPLWSKCQHAMDGRVQRSKTAWRSDQPCDFPTPGFLWCEVINVSILATFRGHFCCWQTETG